MVDSMSDDVRDSLMRDDVSVRVDEDKLGELLLLVAEELEDDRFGGATKVNKVLFFAEFAHMRLTGRPITGAPYQKLERRPAPRRLRPVRDRLLTSGDASLDTETVLGFKQHRLRANRPARREVFSETELKAVQDAIALLRGLFNFERATAGCSLTPGGGAGCSATVRGPGSGSCSGSRRRRVSPV
jgi:hypothetical protein